jgi:transposase-like protein
MRQRVWDAAHVQLRTVTLDTDTTVHTLFGEQMGGRKSGSGAKATIRISDDGQVPRFVPVEELFRGRHFDQEIVVLCVRWYLSYKLSYRDLVAMMGERGIDLAHTTILRWVQHYTPEFEKRWNRFATTVGGSWRMDETYIRVKGEWMYLYRAVDKGGKTVDFYLSRRRDVSAARAFLHKAMKGQRIPTKITLDAYAASHRAVADLKESGELPKRVRIRTSKYLNNIIEQDHRRVKQRLRPMLGLKSFRTAARVISGIELAEKIKKNQFKIGKLGGRTATMPEIWQAALVS